MLFRILRAMAGDYGSITATVRKRRLRLMVADSISKMTLGLMYREGLGRYDGMLFIFGDEGSHPIWMLNMRFSIDIIWLDSRKRIVKIVRDARPCSSILDCGSYSSEKDSMYVVEMGAGAARRMGLKEGDSFSF